MKDIDLKVLLESGAHFGHKTNKWHPSAAKYIYKAVGDIHIIDLAITKKHLEKAREAVHEAASKGKEILFVGTKRQAASVIKKEAHKIGAPYVTSRWIGGFITNWQEVKKNVEKMNQLEVDLKDANKMAKFVKHERILMDRDRAKLESIYGGVRDMKQQPDMLIVVDVKKERTAVLEAQQNKIPVVGVADTNTNSDSITYPIPANDDAVGSIEYVLDILSDAYAEGKARYIKAREAQQKKEQEEKEKAAQKAAEKKQKAQEEKQKEADKKTAKK